MLPHDPAPDEATVAAWEQPRVPVTPRGERRTGIGPVLVLAVAVVTVLAGGTLFMSGYLLGQRTTEQPGTPAALADEFQPFWDTYRTIEQRYAGGKIDEQALVRGAIKGMVDGLGDPYSAYLTPEQYQTGLQDLSGQFEGIGAEIGTRDSAGATSTCSTLGPDCHLIVVSPIEGSPAEKAGLKAGDAILAVDGSALDGLTVDAARDRVRGPKDTTVVLTILRDNKAPFDVSIVRGVIAQREVIDKVLAGGAVGYIRVTGFSDNSAAQFHTALKADVAAGRKEVILDLRGNPGGYVTAARSIASEFLATGPLFWEETADGTQTETDASTDPATTGGATDPAIHLVVLIDGGSASASEIVAGALHDRGRATIVGQTSFGKGTVQQWIELPKTGALKLTIAKWLTPNKNWIHHIGIVPDVVVTPPTDVAAGQDPTLDKAVELLQSGAAPTPSG
ncbi:MAG TPA: S41 family peptidase [Candidatus Dormibacteraeota bacterium]|nr:S41 family peptidase [Candidatus Dormibacteraeota bacterium]